MNTSINIRTDMEIRKKAQRVFSDIGISTSAGINMFLHQVIVEKGLPFIPTVDSRKIRDRWNEQVKEAQTSKKYKSAKSVLRGL